MDGLKRGGSVESKSDIVLVKNVQPEEVPEVPVCVQAVTMQLLGRLIKLVGVLCVSG